MDETRLPADRASAGKSWLNQQGFTGEVLENIGAFVTLWAAFEGRVEHVIWSLEGKPAPHTRPSTDGQPINKWLDRLEGIAAGQEGVLQTTLRDFVAGSRDLAAYRHAILHGWVVPQGIGGPMFISNPRWGNLQRRRASQDAHVHSDMAHLAIAAAIDLLQVAGAFIVCQPGADLREGARDDARRARSEANEVRHVADLMNSEKY